MALLVTAFGLRHYGVRTRTFSFDTTASRLCVFKAAPQKPPGISIF